MSNAEPEAPPESKTFETDAKMWDVTDAQYFADEQHESNSRLKTLRKSVPLYHGMYVTKTIPIPASTKNQEFGTAFHLMVLQPELWQERIAMSPTARKTTKAGEAEWEQFAEDNEDKIWLTEAERESLEKMHESVLANTEARDLLLSDGKIECPMEFRDPQTGILLKIKPDRLLDSGLVIDLKYSHEPYEQEFARSCVNYDYHSSAALYQRGATYLFGHETPHVFIVCGNKAPFECFVYAMDDEAMALGAGLIDAALRRLRDCRDLDDWSSRMVGKTNTIALPRYAYNKTLVY